MSNSSALPHRLAHRMLSSLLGVAMLLSAPLVAPASAQEERRIVVVGADLERAQRRAVFRLVGATPRDKVIRVTTEETLRAASGIVDLPRDTPSISSASITCQPQGAGISVRTRNIQTVTAGMYAQALVTAGVTDAALVVAAPRDAPAEGLTALAGIFKAYRLSPCSAERLDPERERLAHREVALTADLAQVLDDPTAAASVVLGTQEQVVSRKLTSREEIGGVLDERLARSGERVPRSLRNRLVSLMASLSSPDIEWGGYAGGWRLERANKRSVRIAAHPAQRAAPGAERVPTEQPEREDLATGAPAAGSTAVPQAWATGAAVGAAADGRDGGAVAGTVLGVGGGALRVGTEDGAERSIPVGDARGLVVTRDGEGATLGEIREGDAVNVSLGPDGAPSGIAARSAGGGRDASSEGWPWLLTPLLLAVPALIALLARRRRGPAPVRRPVVMRRGPVSPAPNRPAVMARRAPSVAPPVERPFVMRPRAGHRPQPAVDGRASAASQRTELIVRESGASNLRRARQFPNQRTASETGDVVYRPKADGQRDGRVG